MTTQCCSPKDWRFRLRLRVKRFWVPLVCSSIGRLIIDTFAEPRFVNHISTLNTRQWRYGCRELSSLSIVGCILLANQGESESRRPENWDEIFLRNFGSYKSHTASSYPRRYILLSISEMLLNLLPRRKIRGDLLPFSHVTTAQCNKIIKSKKHYNKGTSVAGRGGSCMCLLWGTNIICI
jgi:hypothetical protein